MIEEWTKSLVYREAARVVYLAKLRSLKDSPDITARTALRSVEALDIVGVPGERAELDFTLLRRTR